MRIIENNPSENPKVSVLRLEYNTSKSLGQCLDSLVAQMLGDIEIIYLGVGSTDDSPDILLDYQKRRAHPGGQQAEFGVWRHDEPWGFPTRSDFVKYSYYNYSSEGDVKVRPYEDRPYYTAVDPRDDMTLAYEIPSIWAVLYKRAMLADNGIRFNETLGALCQDASFVFRCWASARRSTITPDCQLHYCVDAQGKRAFTLRTTEEYRAVQAAGELDPSLFSPENWQVVEAFMDDHEVALQAYSEIL